MDLLDPIKKMMMAGIGVPEKLKEITDDLVKKGELSESQGAKLIKEWSEKAEKGTSDITKSINETVGKALEKMNIPSMDEVEKLHKEIKSLSKKIHDLEKK